MNPIGKALQFLEAIWVRLTTYVNEGYEYKITTVIA